MQRKISAYLALNRPLNSMMLGFAVIVGAVIAGGIKVVPEYYTRLFLGFITGFSIGSAAMITNDIFDVEIDRINQPHRPLPSGLIGLREAGAYATAWCVIGLISAALTGVATLLLALLSLITSIAYNYKGKKTGLPGNLMVSFNVSIPFIYGPLLVDSLTRDILVYITMIFLANTSREIIKDIADVEGDASRGILSLPIILGARKAGVIASVILVLAVALSPLPFLWGMASTYYAFTVLIADTGFIYTAISIARNPATRNSLKQKKLMLIWMLIGLIAFLLARI